MNWFFTVLAALRIVYRVVVCVLCKRRATCKKAEIPAGWTRGEEGLVCNLCRAVGN
jgi:primosomal protein N'